MLMKVSIRRRCLLALIIDVGDTSLSLNCCKGILCTGCDTSNPIKTRTIAGHLLLKPKVLFHSVPTKVPCQATPDWYLIIVLHGETAINAVLLIAKY